ncbi:hypothetical protein NQ318_003735 [Aromia moschata]|uniref:Uncharacterized protein n=1 Tax=Aromia moschata TaxID=1265417 RepID=A0AAV8XG33_9CUCU|nr:hypothetical protein NQ318_003735 [Aromia moschata]
MGHPEENEANRDHNRAFQHERHQTPNRHPTKVFLFAPRPNSARLRGQQAEQEQVERRQQEPGPLLPLHEDAEKEEKPSLLERIFPRKSNRKKKSKEEKENMSKHEIKIAREESVSKRGEKSKQEEVNREERTFSLTMTSMSVAKSYTESTAMHTNASNKHEASKPIAAPRSGAASRQRVVPIDIPATPEEMRRRQLWFIRNRLRKNRRQGLPRCRLSWRTDLNRDRSLYRPVLPSPPRNYRRRPPQSPKSPRSPRSAILPSVISSKTEFAQYTKASTNTTKYVETRVRSEDIRNKMKIPGLSSLQQRVLSLNDDETDNSFKSLTDFVDDTPKPSRPITKSHSFKATKKTFDTEKRDTFACPARGDFIFGERKEDHRISFTKAASLDSVKNLEEQTHQSEMKFEVKPVISEPVKTDRGSEKDKSRTLNELEGFRDSITISGPSHTAVVNVTSNSEDFTSSTSKMTSSSNESNIVQREGSKTISIKENQVSVTKIQLKREMTQITQSTVTVPKSSVPEFLNKQLNKVEARPSSNIIFSMKSPRVAAEEQNRPKTLFNFTPENEVVAKPPAPRKFSKENLEIIEKEEKEEEQPPKTSPIISVTPLTAQPLRFKKNDGKNGVRKPSIPSTPESPIKEKPLFKNKSASLDSLRSDANESDQSSQDSLDKLEEIPKEKISSPISETVILRRKSVANKKNDEEPELMKVFARRSLKLKDNDVESIQENLTESKTRDSDKENQVDSPVDDRKKWYVKQKDEEEVQRRKSGVVRQESLDAKSPIKEPLTEAKITDPPKNNAKEPQAESPVAMRRPMNHSVFISQRAVSVNPPKSGPPDLLVKKQSSFADRRRTDQWITQFKNEDVNMKDKIQDNIISSDFITEPKNFNQRKAEWEKRAQQSQKKTTP